ncbi:hypothetical protein K502DRAFT_345719 [Neoconidiobolus thromboides FSU 785]|nr:hypothetical protein K502DRAFT_345719 [Neoconidiobolus thromboides FSU 785]
MFDQERNHLFIKTNNYGSLEGRKSNKGDGENELSFLKLITLTIALAGMQFTWTIELAYGTLYLVSLGMPKPILSIVWLAGPLSGLLVQPVIGCISDKSTSKFGRRRPFIITGYLIVVVSMVLIAYTEDIVSFFYKSKSDNYNTNVLLLASLGFYLLDFSINAVQACLRALIVDVSPLEQQEIANAYASRMIGIGNIIGYFVGFVDLPKVFPYLGSSQMKVLCILASTFFAITLAITCFYTIEKQYESDCDSLENLSVLKFSLYVFKRIIKSLRNLPDCIQKVCNVQFFAWIGWFPFLFYSTTWVAEILSRTENPNRPVFLIEAAKVGSFALFLYSIVSLFASFILPAITFNEVAHHRNQTLNGVVINDTLESPPIANESNIISKLFSFLNIRVLFALSHFLFGILMLSGYFVNSIFSVTFIIATCGVSWAIMMWAPFSIIGEFTRILVSKANHHNHQIQPDDLANTSNSIRVNGSEEELELDAGLILGVHNIYIVLPQFIVNFFSTFVFYFYGASEDDVSHEKAQVTAKAYKRLLPSSIYVPYTNYELEKDSKYKNGLFKSNSVDSKYNNSADLNVNKYPEPVGFLLRIGGVSSIIAGLLTLYIPSPNLIE